MPQIPKPPFLLLPLAVALSLSGCATPNSLAPDPSRFERLAPPIVPEGEARCDVDGDGGSKPCLSQRQIDHLFNATVDALCAANDKLAWLSDYYLGTSLGPSCGTRIGG